MADIHQWIKQNDLEMLMLLMSDVANLRGGPRTPWKKIESQDKGYLPVPDRSLEKELQNTVILVFHDCQREKFEHQTVLDFMEVEGNFRGECSVTYSALSLSRDRLRSR